MSKVLDIAGLTQASYDLWNGKNTKNEEYNQKNKLGFSQASLDEMKMLINSSQNQAIEKSV